MVFAELSVRLNDIGYKNWLKAGYCLVKLRDGLQGFVKNEMRDFHQTLSRKNPQLRKGIQCRQGCKPRGNQFYDLCEQCKTWKEEILKHHTSRDACVHWGNCRPWLWSTEYWEMAKAYMPRGQLDIPGPEKCDAAALLNLINFCDRFNFINRQKVREVIKSRNELMHSCEMRVTPQWIVQYERKLEELIQELKHVPEVTSAGQEMRELLSVDWVVHIPGQDYVDGDESQFVDPEVISTVEAEILQESLRELYLKAQEDSSANAQQLQELQKLRGFIEANKDLKEQFHNQLLQVDNLYLPADLLTNQESKRYKQEEEHDKEEGYVPQKKKKTLV
ncbi:uncharacterized protein CXorf38 homolog [Erpetoichthys calabaricus]|uniref:Chromosome X open reading frame 38 n=1 Tax=Erpetoichthys calabaricus TaxID=27687 RepID=A0A8C4SD70_ERPCA|nr:uncharacterized protein CXorf38 homolog [Erpetoichthys calabaricus]